MISSRGYVSAWDEFPTAFKLLDDEAIKHALCRADNTQQISRALEVVGPLMWFVLRVGPKRKPGWPARVFILSDLQRTLNLKIPSDVELRGIDVVVGPRNARGSTTGACVVRVWRRKKTHSDGVTHLLETADDALIPVPYADLGGLDIADFEAVLSLPAPREVEEALNGKAQ
jgi:hypothetical protein